MHACFDGFIVGGCGWLCATHLCKDGELVALTMLLSSMNCNELQQAQAAISSVVSLSVSFSGGICIKIPGLEGMASISWLLILLGFRQFAGFLHTLAIPCSVQIF